MFQATENEVPSRAFSFYSAVLVSVIIIVTLCMLAVRAAKRMHVLPMPTFHGRVQLKNDCSISDNVMLYR